MLPEDNFSKRSNVPRGRMSACKECEKKRGAENRIKFREKNRAWHKEHNQDPMYKAKRRVYMRDRYREKGMTIEQKKKQQTRQKTDYHTKKWIRTKVACIGKTKTAIKKGLLIPKPCEYPNCKYPHLRVEAHHWDYTQPMWVTWFCSQHHALADRVRKAREQFID
jgi:hypothetical protein